MDPITQAFIQGAAGASGDATYVDDVFSTTPYIGNESTKTVTTGIDLTEDGGMVWGKSRAGAHAPFFYDTERGVQKYIRGDVWSGEVTLSTGLTGFTSTGFTLGSHVGMNDDVTNTAFSFKKTPGFFDVVKYTGNGVRGRQIAHSLKCKPGLILIKFLGGNQNWCVYHKSEGATEYANLNNVNAFGTATVTRFNNTEPTATHFTVGEDSEVNGGGDYIAYLFAGGDSTAAGAHSIYYPSASGTVRRILCGDASNKTADFNFGTGDLTIECWIKCSGTQGTYPRVVAIGPQWEAEMAAIQWDHDNTANRVSFYCYNHSSSTTAPLLKSETKSFNGDGQWHHVAVSRNGDTWRLFVDGYLENTATWSGSPTSADSYCTIGNTPGTATTAWFGGYISNVRIVKGTAVYTSSFRVPIEPLKNITNTKLLCCNNLSGTAATVTPIALTETNIMQNQTDNPFDDSGAFVFGENRDQNIVKCGSYIGNGTANSIHIDCGWEPQWLLIKKASSNENWLMLDCMRGLANRGGNVGDKYLTANQATVEAEYDFVSLTPTGFKLTVVEGHTNSSGADYVYMVIRRSDGYVGKPAEVGTDVFAIDSRNSSQSAKPAFDANFPVDFTWLKKPTVTEDWFVNSRSRWSQYLLMNQRNSITNTTYMTYDYSKGMGNAGFDAPYWTWMWKRHAGFDVVSTDPGTGSGMNIKHSLGKVPEMIWTKKINTSNWSGNSNDNYILDNWFVWHKDYDAVNNVGYLNKDTAGGYAMVKTEAGGANSVSVGFHSNITYTGDENLMMFFASVDGICKVGSYAGANSQQTITTGFQPRFVIIKSTSASRNWVTLDTARGWAAGNDQELNLNKSDSQGNSYDFGAPTATGFTVNYFGGSDDVNVSGKSYIYYAHA